MKLEIVVSIKVVSIKLILWVKKCILMNLYIFKGVLANTENRLKTSPL